MKPRVVALFLLACTGQLGLSAYGQSPQVGVSGPIAIGKLDEMETALDLADHAQRADLLARLGLDAEIANRATEQMLPSDRIRLLPIRTPAQDQFGVAFVPSSVGAFAGMYLLKAHPGKTDWQVIDHQDLDCWNLPCALEVVRRNANSIDDLLVRHVNFSHGSNDVDDQTEAFMVRQGKLQKTLSTPDFLLQATIGADRIVVRASVFLRFPDDSIEETQTVTVGERLQQVKRRFWRWSDPNQMYVPTRFVVVAGRAAP